MLVLLEKAQNDIVNIQKTIILMLSEKTEQKEEIPKVNPLYINPDGELDYQWYKKNKGNYGKGERE
jgi:hypothetical protein